MGSSLTERAQRAERGSGRQRDLEALRELRRREQLDGDLAQVRPSEKADAAWAAALERLATALPEVSMELYPRRLRVIGRGRDNELWLAGHRHAARWCERRYGALIATALAADGWIPRFVAEEDLA